MLRLPRSAAVVALWQLALLGPLCGFADDSKPDPAGPDAGDRTGAPLIGLVTGPQGNAVPEATIRVLPEGLSMWKRDRQVADWIDPLTTVTDGDGRFELSGVGSNPVSLRVEATGLAPRTIHGFSPDDAALLQLEPGRRVEGSVLESRDGKPVPGARVTICDDEANVFGRKACREETADEAGRFEAYGLSRRSLLIGAVSAARAVSRLERVAAGEDDVRGITLRLNPGAAVSGRVVDHRRRPVRGVRVRTIPASRRVGDPLPAETSWPVFTDEDGTFRHGGVLAERSYELRAYRADRPDAASGPFELATGRDVEGVEIVMPAAAELAWRLTDPEGRPLETLEFFMQESGGAAEIGVLSHPFGPDRVRSEVPGSFSVGRLQPGSFDLLIVPEGFAEIRRSGVVLRPAELTELGTLVAREGRVLSGRIVDPDGGPIEGASVQAWDGGPVNTTSRKTESDAGGHYTIAGLRDAEVTLYVEAEGFFGSKAEIPADETLFDVTLDPSAGIGGKVELEDETAPASFSILVYSEADTTDAGRPVGLTRQQGFATPDGSFRVSDLAPGTYTVEARATNWAPDRRSGVVVAAGRVTEMETLTLKPGRTVRGRVIADEDAAAVSGTTVDLRGRRGWMQKDETTAIAGAVSDEAGEFELRGLVPGEFELRAHHFGFAPAQVTLRVDPEPSDEEVVVRLSRGGSLSGTVTDGDGRPSPQRTVVLGKTLTDPEARQASTDADGVYRMERISPGSYEARLVPQTGAGLRITTAAVVIRDGEAAVLNFDDEFGIRLHGMVLRSGEPLARALLFFNPLESVLNLSEMQVATSDDDGRYEVKLGGPGSYRVMVQTNGSGGSSTQISVPDELDVARDIVLELEGIGGTVFDEEGAPIKGASVSARHEGAPTRPLDDLLVAESDAQGRYSIQGLDSGTYRVTAVAAGYRIGVAYPVEAAGAAVDGVDFHLERGPALRGIVVDGEGRGVAGAYVLAAPAGAGDPLNAASAETDINGAFRMTAPAEGALDVTALAPGWAPAHRASVVPPDPEAPEGLVLRVGPGGRLRARLLDPAGAPVAGAYLSVTPVPAYVGSDLGRLLRPVPPTDGDGQALIENLAPGNYAVVVAGHAELPPVAVTVTDRAETPLTLRIP